MITLREQDEWEDRSGKTGLSTVQSSPPPPSVYQKGVQFTSGGVDPPEAAYQTVYQTPRTPPLGKLPKGVTVQNGIEDPL